MLDIQLIRDHPEKVKAGAKKKGLNPGVVDEVLRFDSKRRELIQEVEKLRAERNKLNREDQERGREIKKRLKDIEPELKKIEAGFNDLMFQVPNIPATDVPVGADETGNKVHKTWGKPKKFNFEIKDHVELGLDLNLLDLERGVRVGGFRSFFTKNELVLMEYGLLDYALRFMIKQGFTPMTVPWLVNDEALWGTGYFPWGLQDHYSTQDGTKLIGTAEVSLTAYHQGEILKEEDLPVKMAGISPCFRREIGAHGKDTRGIFRLHQFNKVEQVVLCQNAETESRKWHEQMLRFSEQMLKDLGLPYRVMLMCTGDMGAGQVKKYDIETWYPAQKAYRETHSDSYFLEFQARRLNMRYRTRKGEIKFVHTLNNTVVATPRILGAILENYQNQDGSVTVPKILQPYVGKTKIDKTAALSSRKKAIRD